jgi:hypothetical protein
MDNYRASSWYWIVGNRAPDNIFSAPASAYVPLSDPDYQAFLERGNRATVIDLDGHLSDVLVKAGCPASLVAAAGVSEVSPCGSAMVLNDLRMIMEVRGCSIVSTGDPELSATYGISPRNEDIYLGLQAGITATPPAPWPGFIRDITGAKVMMTAAQATRVMTGILGYVEALADTLVAWAQGGEWSPPSQPTEIE